MGKAIPLVRLAAMTPASQLRLAAMTLASKLNFFAGSPRPFLIEFWGLFDPISTTFPSHMSSQADRTELSGYLLLDVTDHSSPPAPFVAAG